MHLIGVKEDGGWVFSRWELTYRVGWDHIKQAVAYAYGYYDNPEVLVRGNLIDISSKEAVMSVGENGDMTLRGFSHILQVPIMITFYNQLSAVDVNVAQATDEFKNTDYEKFNHSLCQYLDSMELAMYHD